MKLLKTKEVIKKFNRSYDHFRKKIKQLPDFPKPVQVTNNSHPLWDEAEIDKFIESKKAA